MSSCMCKINFKKMVILSNKPGCRFAAVLTFDVAKLPFHVHFIIPSKQKQPKNNSYHTKLANSFGPPFFLAPTLSMNRWHEPSILSAHCAHPVTSSPQKNRRISPESALDREKNPSWKVGCAQLLYLPLRFKRHRTWEWRGVTTRSKHPTHKGSKRINATMRSPVGAKVFKLSLGGGDWKSWKLERRVSYHPQKTKSFRKTSGLHMISTVGGFSPHPF